MKKAALVFGLGLACATWGSGCAEERDPINQVQTGVLPKSFFVGEKLADTSDDPEFYFRTTVVDVSAGAGAEGLFTASDSQPTVRIRWEITQNLLVARLAYELIDGTDGRGTNGPPKADEPRNTKGAQPVRQTNDGQIVASFAILRHFNIQRSYNPSTGEENNVIVENDTDVPWYERKNMRVDWSKNLVTDAYDLDTASQLQIWGGVKWDPIAYWVDDPKSPDAPMMKLDQGYFDVTAKAYAAPQIIHDEEWGDFPACYLLSAWPYESCNTSEVKLRLAFRKVVDTDYEPLDYDGKKMDMFGLFTNDRFGYDKRYGIVDNRWRRFASRWNIWEKSHKKDVACGTTATTPAGADVHRDADGNGTEDECEKVGRGSRCDEFKKLCTLPVRDRKVKPTIWHVNRGFPEDLFASSKKVVDLWSDTVRQAVIAGRLAECRRTQEASCEQQVGWPDGWSDDLVPPVGSNSQAEVPKVFVLCHNPVDPKIDDPLCGKEAVSPRVGDLRYNLFSLVQSPQKQSPWGIMMDAEDPLTGEKISGSVNQWGDVLERGAAQLSDLVALLAGEIAPTDYIKGQNVSEWVAENTRGGPPPKAMSVEEQKARFDAFDPKVIQSFTPRTKSAGGHPIARHKARMKDIEAAGMLGPGNASITQRPTRLAASGIEAKMITPEVAQIAGVNPKLPLTKAVVDRASPLRGRQNPAFRRAVEHRERTARAARHSCRRAGPEGDNLLGLANEAQRLFGQADPKDKEAVRKKRDQVYAWARERFSASVFSHELGHSVGLRHNFAGTFDSLNYQNGYWQLRTKNGAVTATCPPNNTDGQNCVGPRWKDPITPQESEGLISQYATTSVMDYPGDQVQDMVLQGKYDRAAVRFAYGGTVDVWNRPGVNVNGAGDGKLAAFRLTAFSDSPGLFGVYYFSEPGKDDYAKIHYSQYQKEFKLLGECKDDPASPLRTTCRGAPLDVVDYRDLKDYVTDPDYPEFTTAKRAVDPTGRVRRGYMFSSDEFADSGNVPSFSYDAGADAYEQVTFLEGAYESRYVLDAFRRNRTTFNSEAVVSRTQSHYLDAIQNIAKTFGFAMVLESPDDPIVRDPWPAKSKIQDDGNYGPLWLASTKAFDLFTRNLLRPEPGKFCSTGEATCPFVGPVGVDGDIFLADPSPTKDTKYAFTLGLGQGRFIHNDFDYDQGYWWSDYQTQVGSFYDKMWAMYYLAEGYDSFISNSKEDFVDGRYKNINFATIYPTQVQRLYATILTGDVESMAPWVETGNTLIYPAWRNVGSLGTRPASAKVVDPAFGWNEQLYAMVWGTMLFPAAWSQSFMDDARIVARAGETITWPAAETYTFVDPTTSITYRAHSTGTETNYGVAHERSIGARMLEWANTLLCRAYKCDLDAVTGKPKLNPDGTPRLLLAAGKIQPNIIDEPGGIAAYKRYVTNIDVMRELVSTYVRPIEGMLPAP